MRTAVQQQPPLGIPLNYSHPLTQGLIGAWLLNEGGGQLARDSTRLNKIDGALSAGAIYKETTQGQSVFFDGVNDVITIPTFYTPEVPVTIAAWVNPAVSGTNVIAVIGTTSNAQYLQQVSDKFRATTNNGSFVQAISNTSLVVGTWFFVVGVFATSTLRKIYVNGNFEVQNTSSAVITTSTASVLIGNRHGASAFYSGVIQNVMMWKRILTDSEIRQLYVSPYSMFIGKSR